MDLEVGAAVVSGGRRSDKRFLTRLEKEVREVSIRERRRLTRRARI